MELNLEVSITDAFFRTMYDIIASEQLVTFTDTQGRHIDIFPDLRPVNIANALYSISDNISILEFQNVVLLYRQYVRMLKNVIDLLQFDEYIEYGSCEYNNPAVASVVACTLELEAKIMNIIGGPYTPREELYITV